MAMNGKQEWEEWCQDFSGKAKASYDAGDLTTFEMGVLVVLNSIFWKVLRIYDLLWNEIKGKKED